MDKKSDWPDSVYEYMARGGNEPFSSFSTIKECEYEHQVNDYLLLKWTLLGIRVEDAGDPKMRCERFRYVVGWKMQGEPQYPAAK